VIELSSEADEMVMRVRRLGRLLLWTVYVAYYRWLFGRRIPFAEPLAARVAAWERRWRKGDIPEAKSVWESDYRNGRWRFLSRLDEMPRYSVIVEYVQDFKPDAAVLDVGCGEGVLFRRYRSRGYSRYVGIDIAETALAQLRPEQDARTTFVCADAETYVPSERFDVVVFNETLYYFRDPLGTAARYTRALSPDGIVIVSTFAGSHRGRAILRALKDAYPLVDETRIVRGPKSWVCAVLAPGRHPSRPQDIAPRHDHDHVRVVPVERTTSIGAQPAVR
jgi:2-polyprenyl-3-methyl-5-hydroxy-6-metoxy-1,4-benzoquinol methylase